jgi:hypothetical protein
MLWQSSSRWYTFLPLGLKLLMFKHVFNYIISYNIKSV